MRWMSSRMPSTSRATSFLYCSSFGFGGALGVVVAVCCAGAAMSDAVTAAIAATIQKRDRCMGPPELELVAKLPPNLSTTEDTEDRRLKPEETVHRLCVPSVLRGGELEFCNALLERDSRTDSHDPRRNYVQRTQERRAAVEAGVLLGVRVEQIEQIQEPRYLQVARQREHFFRAQIEQCDVVLASCADRLGEHGDRRAVVQARRRDEHAADRLSRLIAQNRRHADAGRRFVRGVQLPRPRRELGAAAGGVD